jgi:hypothetical protein
MTSNGLIIFPSSVIFIPWSGRDEMEQQNYVSINKSLLNYLEVLNELEPIDDSKYGSYVIMIYASSGNTSDDDFQDVMGETVFAEVNTSIELEKRYLSGSINDPELKHWV